MNRFQIDYLCNDFRVRCALYFGGYSEIASEDEKYGAAIFRVVCIYTFVCPQGQQGVVNLTKFKPNGVSKRGFQRQHCLLLRRVIFQKSSYAWGETSCLQKRPCLQVKSKKAPWPGQFSCLKIISQTLRDQILGQRVRFLSGPQSL